jgi:hypothetical protein
MADIEGGEEVYDQENKASVSSLDEIDADNPEDSKTLEG